MNKIEEGCLALVIGDITDINDPVGTVIVGSYIGAKHGFREKDLWSINKEIFFYSKFIKIKFKICPERYLMRLNDPDIEQELEAEKLEEICNTFTT